MGKLIFASYIARSPDIGYSTTQCFIDNDPFLSIRVKPSSDLRRLEEVLVITKMTEETPAVASGPAPMRAADILSQRLPSIPKPDPNAPKTPGVGATATPTPANKPAGAAAEQKKEGTATAVGVKPPSAEATSPKLPATGSKPAASGTATATGQPAAPKSGTETRKAAGAIGQTSITDTTAGGAPMATPTPKPKATPAKKTKSSAPPDASQSKPEEKKPEQPETAPATTPTATPSAPSSANQEKPPR